MEEATGKKANYLIYLAKDSMIKTWKEKLSNEQEIKYSFQTYELPKISKKGNINVEERYTQLSELSKNISIGFINYQAIYDLLEDEIAKNQDDEILVNLYQGFNQELLKRELVIA